MTPQKCPFSAQHTTTHNISWTLRIRIVCWTSIATMNDGAPDKRSPLAVYSVAKADSESEQSEKAIWTEHTGQAFDDIAKKNSPSENGQKIGLSGPPKEHIPRSLGASKAMADILKEAADGEDFDMSMVPMAFPQRVSTRVLRSRHSHFARRHATKFHVSLVTAT